MSTEANPELQAGKRDKVERGSPLTLKTPNFEPLMPFWGTFLAIGDMVSMTKSKRLCLLPGPGLV